MRPYFYFFKYKDNKLIIEKDTSVPKINKLVRLSILYDWNKIHEINILILF